jgi:hypothetical protein
MPQELDPYEIAAAAVISGQPPFKTPLEVISALTREQMCFIHRFAPSGHPFFRRGTPECDAFEKRYKALGGMSPEISKQLDQLGHN